MEIDNSLKIFGLLATTTAFIGFFNYFRQTKEKPIVLEKGKAKKAQVLSLANSLSLSIKINEDYNLVKIDHLSNWLGEYLEIKNPLLIQEGDEYHRGQFLPEQSFVTNGAFCLSETQYEKLEDVVNAKRYMKAGPKKFIYFDPKETIAAIVTCGGLCPGLNVVVRELVLSLWHNYGCRKIYGIPMGFQGFLNPEKWIDLDPTIVKDIHKEGGSILGNSRGSFHCQEIINTIEKMKINMCFCIGGDGTHRAILQLSKVVREKRMKVSLVGIPKTVDNDITLIDKTFGFDSAIESAQIAIDCAHVEATSAPNGVGLVKLMGRDAGHIALMATLSNRDVNICLIPEFKYDLYGPKGLIAYICKRLREKNHCVIVVGEGAGKGCRDAQISDKVKRDASGNIIPWDIGAFLKEEIVNVAKKYEGMDITLKYLDPTYMIRAVSANPLDKHMCAYLAQNAVHGAMAGFTNFTVGPLKGQSVCIPIDSIAQSKPSLVKPDSRFYLRMKLSTGQPDFLNDEQ